MVNVKHELLLEKLKGIQCKRNGENIREDLHTWKR
jgi:hypothetical protein